MKPSYYKTDVESILSQIKHEDETLKRKRRWLLGFPSSDAEQIEFQNPKFPDNISLPESLLREDDVFYETVRTSIEEALGAWDYQRKHGIFPYETQLLEMSKIKKLVLSDLDKFTTRSLYELAKVFGDSTNIEKTRPKLKRVIKESFPRILESRGNNKVEICKQLSPFLTNPGNYRNTSPLALKAHYYRVTVLEALHRLEELPYQTLHAMFRKLKGKRGLTPGLHGPKQKNKGYLVTRVTKLIKRIVSKLCDDDDLQEPLAKAMAVVGLSLKLASGSDNLMLKEFNRCTSDIKSLQNEIIKAIKLVNTNLIRYPMLKKMQLILEPNADTKDRGLRAAVRKMLTEYLFECCDMDSIPSSLTEALALLGRNSRHVSHSTFQEDSIQEEVECTLSLSAQCKQIVLDFLPDYEFDQNFANAYMEDTEGSDEEADNFVFFESDQCITNNGSVSIDLTNGAECVGESILPTSEPENNNSTPHIESDDKFYDDVAMLESVPNSGKEAPNVDVNSHAVQGSSCFYGIQNMEKNQSDKLHKESVSQSRTPIANENGEEHNMVRPVSKNDYLSIQDICDESSLFVYNFVGRLLEEFAESEGSHLKRNASLYLRGQSSDAHVQGNAGRPSSLKDQGSLLVRVTEELLPSLTGREKLMKLMGL